LRHYLESVGVNIPLAVSQESIARIRGYADWNALAADINPRGKPVRTALTDAPPDDDNLQAYPRELAELSVEPSSRAISVLQGGVKRLLLTAKLRCKLC
jgi:hypothetical protein